MNARLVITARVYNGTATSGQLSAFCELVRALLLISIDGRRSSTFLGEEMMKPAVFALAAVVAIATAVPAGAAQVTPRSGAVVSTDKPADKQIEKQIKADPMLKQDDIHVSVKDNVAILTGTVPTDAERARAAELAKVAGISRVDNQIVVDPYAKPKGTTGKLEEKTKDDAKKVGEKTKEGSEKVWDKTKEGAEKVADETSDAYILSRVKSRFVGVDVLKGSDINVDVDKHVVTLKGTVPSEAARAQAIDIAKRTEGVHDVVDHLAVGPKK
jgi:hyperosmotically inducible periplasmic protein